MLCLLLPLSSRVAAISNNPYDYDKDGKSDLAVWRPGNGLWYIINSSGSPATTVQGWGVSGDVPVPGDYDGDGKTDLSIWRPGTGAWFIINSSNGSQTIKALGVSGDVPVPGNYDGDTMTDIAVWRPSSGTWYITNSSGSPATTVQGWGVNGDVPVPGDYDGDHKTDIAIWRPGDGLWYIINSSGSPATTIQGWGVSGDVPVPGDYDGDGKADLSIWRPGTGAWFIINSSNGSQTNRSWGVSGDLPVPTDYDKDGKSDIAVWRPSSGTWYITNSSGSPATTVQGWGVNGDVPVSMYMPRLGGSGGPPPANTFPAAMVDPVNRTGRSGEDLFSGNYNWSLPLVGLPGRANLDLSLSLSYNSLVWTKAASSIKFDADNGFPAPGFHLGFPVIQAQTYTSQANSQAYLMIMPSGSRVELRSIGGSIYESADSSFIQFDASSNILRTPDGSALTYEQSGSNLMCREIKDRNGNKITVVNGGGRINTMTDTLGRVITFNYSGSNLTSITQIWNGATHTWAQFTYQTIPLAPNFQGLTVTAPASVSALKSVSLADGAAYRFDYTSFGYGQVSVIHHNATDGHELASTTYTTDNSTADCPRLTRRQDFAENWNSNVASSTFIQVDPFGSGIGTATLPDGTQIEEDYPTSGFNKGLLTQSKIISGAVAKKTAITNWTQDAPASGYPANPRVNDTSVIDDAGNQRKTSVAYTTFNLPRDTFEYAADGATVLRHTQIDYVTDAAYINRRIIGLPKEQRLYQGNGTANLVARESYEYDWSSPFLQNQGAPTQHDEVNYSDAFVQGRGNLSAVNRFDVTTGQSLQAQLIGYNTTGNPIFVRDAMRNVLTISYTDAFSAGAPAGLTLAYPTTTTDGDNFSSTATYHYDLGVATKTHDPKGAELLMEYNDPAGRLTRRTYFDSINSVSGTYTRLEYPANGTEIRSYVLLDPGIEAFSAQVSDGAGRTIGSVRNLPASTSGYSGQKFIYDAMGRLRQQSNPAEITYSPGQPVANWTPTGDDAGGWVFTTQDYDWKGRPTTTTYQDQVSIKRLSYSGCGCAGGEVVTLTDEVGRVQKTYHDVLGRVMKVETLRPDQNVYRTTTTSYNARDQILTVVQQVRTMGTAQTTTMSYDGQGRLRTRQLPIQTSPTVYDYYPDDTIQVVTDPRGATATYGYNNRHLVTSIDYSAPSPIVATAPVGFQYDAAGNRTRMTDGLGRKDYEYDTWSRRRSETERFGLPNSYSITYEYNLAGEVKKIIDPFGANFNYAYDQAGQLQSVTGSPAYAGVTQYAANMQYRAWGGLKHLDYGDNPRQLNLTYDPRLQVHAMAVQATNYSSTLGSWIYSYYRDKRIQSSFDQTDSTWDRSYSYGDPLGRLTGASSGEYGENFAYDVWGNMTSRNGSIGASNFSYVTTYTNDRDQQFQYDAAGNVVRDNQNHTNTYDAAGRLVASSFLGKTWAYDGDGSVAKWVQSNTTTYNVGSSVLGKVLAELDQAGNKRRTFVYANDQLLAKQQFSQVWWEHVDASGSSIIHSGPQDGQLDRQESEPLGVKVNINMPENDPDPILRPTLSNPSTGCLLDGVDAPCNLVLSILDRGAGRLDSPHGDLDRAVKSLLETGKLPQSEHPDGNRRFDPFAINNIIVSTGPGGGASLDDQNDKGITNIPRDKVICVDNGDGTQTCRIIGDDPDDGGPPVQIYVDSLAKLNAELALRAATIRDQQIQKEWSRLHPGKPLDPNQLLQQIINSHRQEQAGYDDCVGKANHQRLGGGARVGAKVFFGSVLFGLALVATDGVSGALGRATTPALKVVAGAKLGAGLSTILTGSVVSDALINEGPQVEQDFNNRIEDCVKKYPNANHDFNLLNPKYW